MPKQRNLARRTYSSTQKMMQGTNNPQVDSAIRQSKRDFSTRFPNKPLFPTAGQKAEMQAHEQYYVQNTWRSNMRKPSTGNDMYYNSFKKKYM